ncbi:alpha/beta fold hydrolase [Leifsonia sp. L25]|uniref:alpha/beta fold hydrolase n=1 Tax=Leifsonia sp. L25 TaxID=3423957 RepID=UPI003D6959F3
MPDLRGYGRSTAPAPRADHSQASKRAMADDVLALMRTLGHERFGSSSGTTAAATRRSAWRWTTRRRWIASHCSTASRSRSTSIA